MVEQKLSAARTRLILDKPFLGALVLRLPLKEAVGTWCASSATDARSIYYNAEYMLSLSLSQVQFVLAHEALHCGLSHFARRHNRDLNRWNIACDHAVNLMLSEDGLELPPGALLDDTYQGLAAEEIYPLIKQDSEEETLDQHLYDNPHFNDSNQQPDNYSPDHPADQNTERKPDRQPEQNRDNSDRSNKQPHSPPAGSKTEAKTGTNNTDKNLSNPANSPTTRQPQASPDNELNTASDQSDISSNQNRQAIADQHSNQSQRQENTDAQEHAGSEIKSDQPPTETNKSNDESADTNQRPPALSAQEREQLNVQWQQRLAGAAQQASQAGKMQGSVARLVERLLRSTVPWRTVLARYMSSSARQDYNITRPSQRREGDAILPSLHSRQTNVLIALDTSGSIEDDELSEFVGEVNAIKSLVNARITVLACDRELDSNGPWVFEPWDQLVLPETLEGRGGTDFNPVFDWIASNNIQLDLVVYFTDARGRFPKIQPATETLWLVKGGASVPWGQRIQLN